MGNIYVRSFAPPSVDLREALRYAGVRGEDPELRSLLEDCLGEVEDQLRYDVCYTFLPVDGAGRVRGLGDAFSGSDALCRHLTGCERAVVFAATVGLAPDRLVWKYGAASPTRALMHQALATERIEALCDAFCLALGEEAALRGESVTGRFSPGYGDLPTEGQREIFQLLDCPRRIGVSLGENLLMGPVKSVTALVGLRVDPREG